MRTKASRVHEQVAREEFSDKEEFGNSEPELYYISSSLEERDIVLGHSRNTKGGCGKTKQVENKIGFHKSWDSCSFSLFKLFQ